MPYINLDCRNARRNGIAKKKPDVTITEVVRRFKTFKPMCEQTCRSQCRLKLKKLGQGSGRKAYKVNDLDLVVKFPLGGWSVDESVQEYNAYRRIMRNAKFKTLRPLMPRIYFCDTKTGVILMRKYQSIPTHLMNSACIRTRDAFIKAKCISGQDIHSQNVAMTKKGQIKMIDLGMVKLS